MKRFFKGCEYAEEIGRTDFRLRAGRGSERESFELDLEDCVHI